MVEPLRRKPHQSVVYIDSRSAPRLITSGENLVLEKLPVGTRVIYSKPPIRALPDRAAAIRYALEHPQECDPLRAQLRAGMRVTIALDDISLPLPPMVLPDVRQSIVEILLELLTAAGVEDIHLVIANSLHRRMTPAEMRRMVGPQIFREFYPGRYYNHDAEAPDGLATVGQTSRGEPLRINRRCAESDLVIYVNINLVPMDGGHKSVAVGLCDYESLRVHHDPETMLQSNSYMDPVRSDLEHKVARLGKLVDEKLSVFHIETALNNQIYSGQMDFLLKNEDEFSAWDWTKLHAVRQALAPLPYSLKRKIFHSMPAQYQMIACNAGRTEPTHRKTLQRNFDQYTIPLQGQCDILVTGIPHISPYNVNSILNPILVQVMGLGYFFNMYRGKPLLKKGGTLILHHPCYDEFDAGFHPSYVEFFQRLLPETRDAFILREKYEREFASNPTYVEMYRRGHAYHGAHPFFMWYWGENGRQYVGRVIVAGAENVYAPATLGWERAESLSEAIEMARSPIGSGAEITMLRQPMILIAEVE